MAISSVSSSGLNFTGLATGIDTAKVVDGLTALNQKRIDALKKRQADITTKQTAFATLQGKLFDLQFKSNALARSAGGAFDGRKAATSDATALSAAAGTAAVPGTYTVTVNALAQANQVASAGFTDPNAALKTGTLTFQVGTGTPTTVTLDSRNATLQGLSDAINAAGGDVRAAVVNDGSAAPYRLLLTANKTGAVNGITLTNDLTGGTAAAIDPTATTVQAAADARVTVGGGAGALAVSGPTNQLDRLIPGVSLKLLAADPTRPITLTVANDTDAAVKAAQDFVDSYNDTRDYLAAQTKYDPDAKQAGVLLGNRDAAAVADDLAAALTATVPGASPNANRLSSVGLALTDKGKLTFDPSKLTAALSGTGGATPDDLKKLFALAGTSDDPGVQFVLGGNKTQPTAAGGTYTADVTSPATRAVVVSGGSPAGSVVITPANASLQLKINGLLASGVTIPAGTYTPDALVAILQQRINAAPALDGNPVAVSLDSAGKVRIASQQYGSSSAVQVVGGTALSALGFGGGESASGTDVAGRFVVSGATEAATGSGQILTGIAGNKHTDGLQVRATAPTAGTAGVSVSQGLASRLSSALNKYLDATTGRLAAVNDTYAAQSADIGKTIDRQNDLLATKTADLQAQFASMETAVNQLKGVQTQLSSLVGTK